MMYVLETKVLEVGRYTLIIGDMLCRVLKQVEFEFEKLLFGRKILKGGNANVYIYFNIGRE